MVRERRLPYAHPHNAECPLQGHHSNDNTRLPIRLLTTTTNGWQDLAVSVSGGGIRPGYEVKLAFDGKKYPSNPTIAPAKRIPSQTPGTTLIQEGAESQARPVYR